MEAKIIRGMTTCKVCGRDFPLLGEEHYVATDEEMTGISAALGGKEPKIFDALDCPHCGCQNILQPRKRTYYEETVEECEDCDGCCGCSCGAEGDPNE